MRLLNILSEMTISNTLKQSFESIFQRIHDEIKNTTDVNISPQWLAGLLKQYNNFKYLDSMYTSYRDNKNEALAKDAQARIIARDVLTKYSLFDPTNNYTPKKKDILSLMRQFYTEEIHTNVQDQDGAKAARSANSQEYEEWFDSLTDEQKNYVTQLQEMNPEEMAQFRGIITAKEHKKEFVTKLYHWINSNDVARNIAANMKLITPNNKISIENIKKLREFLAGVADPRLKDILSKASVYRGKKIVHDAHLAKNKVIKDFGNKQTRYYKMLKLYHYISRQIGDQVDRERTFERLLSKIPQVHDKSGNLTLIGKGARKLFKLFDGKTLDPQEAIKTLQTRTNFPADKPHRAKKAHGRGESIRKVSEI